MLAYLCGPTGVGKSWLASALGHKACRDNRSVLYQRIPKLFADLALAPRQELSRCGRPADGTSSRVSGRGNFASDEAGSIAPSESGLLAPERCFQAEIPVRSKVPPHSSSYQRYECEPPGI